MNELLHEVWWGHGAVADLGGAQTATALLDLFLRFAALSLLSVGGAMTTAAGMQKFLVLERSWLTDGQFTGAVALAQAAPGPNVLFVAVLGWNVAGMPGVVATLAGTLLPSSVLAVAVGRLGALHREARALRAFNAGMAPLILGLLLATAWLLAQPTLASHGLATAFGVAASAAWMLATRASPLWPVAAGAVAGAMGWYG